MADSYYVRYRGRTVGPYTLVQSQQMARKGQLARTSEVSTDGQSWSQAASYPEIFEPPASSRSLTGSSSPFSLEADPFVTSTPVTPSPLQAAAKSTSEWYYTSEGEQKGPTSVSNIIGWVRAGSLTSNDRVWREGLDSWVSLSDVPEFSAAIGPAVPHRPTAGNATNAGGGAFCRECGCSINRRAVICPQCGVPQQSDNGDISFPTRNGSARGSKQAQGGSLVVWGYVCAGIALLFLPPLFALASFIIGIVNLTRNQIGHGIAQIILSFVCGFMGMVIGAAMMS
jgi:hypothetical protein